MYNPRDNLTVLVAVPDPVSETALSLKQHADITRRFEFSSPMQAAAHYAKWNGCGW
jgi:hypothetical protein